MDDSMVTARMLDEKKRKGARILAREGLSASQAINLMYDKMIEEGEAGVPFEPIRVVSAMRRSGPLLLVSSILYPRSVLLVSTI